MYTYNQNQIALMQEVLKPTAPETYLHAVAVQPEPGSVLDKFAEKTARAVRDVYRDGKCGCGVRKEHPEFSERWGSACMTTWLAKFELTQTLLDDHERAIAETIFERAGWNQYLMPTTVATQDKIKEIVAAGARNARQFLAWQDNLAI